MSSPLAQPWFKKPFRSRSGRTPQAATRTRRSRRLVIEHLEDRLTPSSYVASNINYSGSGSLGAAITAAVTANDPNAVITFSGVPNNATIQLNSSDVSATATYGPTAFVINGGSGTHVTIDGAGARG